MYGIVPLLVHASLAPHILGSRVAVSRKRGVINTFGLLEDLAGALEPGPARDRYRTVVRLLDWYAKHHREAPGNLGELERDVSLIRRFARPLPVLADERERDYFGLARELALFRDLRFARDVEASSAHKIRAGFARFLRGIADHPEVAGSHAAGQGSGQNLDPRLVNTPLLVLAYAIERMPDSPEPDGETARRVTPFRLPGWRPAPGLAHHWGDAPHWLAGPPSPRRRLLVTVLALVVAAGAVTGTVRGLACQPAVLPADDSRPGDVLLVPGYGGSTTAPAQLAERITAAGGSGFHATVVRLAGNGTGDLQEQANVLNGYVNQALAAGSGPVTVIGYSAGGVVAWLWDVDYDGVAKARRIITLGSPLHGADLAAVGAADHRVPARPPARNSSPAAPCSAACRAPRRPPPAVAVPVDHGRPGGPAARLRPADRRGERPAAIGVPRGLDRARPAPHRPARRRHRPACPARRRHYPAPPFGLPFAAGSRRFRHRAITGYCSVILLNSYTIRDWPLA